MIKKYFKKLKEKRKVKQHLRGYEYACGCLVSKEKTIEQLWAEDINTEKFMNQTAFWFGMIDAIEDLYFYCNYEDLKSSKKS